MFLTHPKLNPVLSRKQKIQGFFDSTPAVDILPARDMFALAGPLIFKSEMGVLITVPTGTTSDFASIPKFLDWCPWFDINGVSRYPGLLHDGLYRLGRSKGKSFCDLILREACLDEGMAWVEARIYYNAVKWFGANAWRMDGENADFGPAASNFVSQETYDAWKAGGGSIYT